MRGLTARCGALAAAMSLALALAAAPVVPPPGGADPSVAGSANLRAEALNYAHLLLPVIAEIEDKYVRPVKRAELIQAALTALYDAARQPVPASLNYDIQRASEGDVLGLLVRARERLGHADALRGNRALLVSLQALPRVLDPYCGVSNPQTFRYLDLDGQAAATGLEFVGVAAPALGGVAAGGAFLPGDIVLSNRPSVPAGPIRVQTVVPGSPAARAGLRPGDLIVKLDGQSPEAPAFAGLLQRLLPNQPVAPNVLPEISSRPVWLTVLRSGRDEPFEVSLAAGPFRPETVFGARRRPDGSWDYLLDPADRIGYIRLGAINQHFTQPAFRDALTSLQNQSVRGLVLDLRWFPVGYLTPAASMARMLLPDHALVASQLQRDRPEMPVPHEAPAAPFLHFPIVALVNAETSGAGELIAAALQDSGRGVIAGQRTVGKGTVQTEVNPSGIPFKLTTGIYIRPSRKNLQRLADSKLSDDWGVRPDPGRELPVTAELSRQLKEWWVLHTLRPAGSTEVLPLDDPENDPQRHAAVQMVRELLK